MTVLLAIIFILLILYLCLLFYYGQGWASVDIQQVQPGFRPQTNITVIIAARNEEKHLPQLLDSLLKQTYPPELFEVLVIDDHSTDNTVNVIDSYVSTNIRRISLKDHMEASIINSYKKKAIETGIAQSKGKLIVTTDADCTVLPDWLIEIAYKFEKDQPVFIAAPVSINCKNNFIQIFQCLDFMSLQGITGGAVKKNFHNMCNGANMAYERGAFYAVNGYTGIDGIASGDDMLLMDKIEKKFPGRICFLKSTDAVVSTAPVTSLKNFINQRVRWASKAGKYQDKTLTPVLLVIYLFNLMLLLLPLITIVYNPQVIISGIKISLFYAWSIILLIKIISELIFLLPVAQFFGKQSLLLLFPLMQPFHILYTVIAGFLGKTGSYEWKERKVK